MVFFFWPSLLIVLYTFVGYGIVLFVLVKTLRFFKGGRNIHYNIDSLPTFTLIIASYNDAGILREKISNTFALKYPMASRAHRFCEELSPHPQSTQRLRMFPLIP